MTRDASMAAVDDSLRLHKKDPNLDAANYFWDMRKEYLPFYRAFQFTEQLIKINEDENEDENDVDNDNNTGDNDNLIIGIDIKVPSKLDIKKSMERNPNSIKLLQRRSHNNDHNKDNNNIIIQSSSSSSSEFEYLNCHQRLVSSKHDKVLINSKFLQDLLGGLSIVGAVDNNTNNQQQKQQECRWFRMGNRIIPQYAILYKVRGITCTCKRGSTFDPDHIPIIGDVLDHLGVSSSSSSSSSQQHFNIRRPLVPVGRLDQESEGLILLTNDGSFSRFCTSPAIGLKKVYRVFVKDKGRRRWEHDTPLHELYQRLRSITDIVKHDNIQQQTTTPDDDDWCIMENGNNMKVKQIVNDSNGRAYSSSSEFRAESCTIIDYATIPWVSSDGVSDKKNKNSNNNKSSSQTTTTSCLHALLDIEMTEGKNREVRRLMKSIGFVTHMLARSTIGNSLEWINNNNNNNGDDKNDNNSNDNDNDNDNDNNPIDDVNWQFHIPTTIDECQKKCNAYDLDHRELSSNNKNGGTSSLLQLAIENASHASAFRYLENSEVDDIFAASSSTFNSNNATTKT